MKIMKLMKKILRKIIANLAVMMMFCTAGCGRYNPATETIQEERIILSGSVPAGSVPVGNISAGGLSGAAGGEGAGAISGNAGRGGVSVGADGIAAGFGQFSGVSVIRCVSGHEAAVLADKLYLYDPARGAVVAETDRAGGWYDDFGFYSVENGYVVTVRNEDSELECIYYDKALNRQETVNILKETGVAPVFVRQAAVSADGQLIAVSDFSSGLCIYDRRTGAVNPVLTLEDSGKVAALEHIAFSDKDRKIVFVGQRIPAGSKDGESIYGSIDIDGSHLYIGAGKDFGRILAYDTHVIFGQDVPEGRASGEAWVYFPADGSTEKISLAKKPESNRIWGSCEGKYFGTAVSAEGEGWTVRIYETDGGRLVWDEVYGIDVDRYAAPWIYIFDDMGTALLCFQPLGDNGDCITDSIAFVK